MKDSSNQTSPRPSWPKPIASRMLLPQILLPVVLPLLLILLAVVFGWFIIRALITGEITLYRHTAIRRRLPFTYCVYIAFYAVFGAFALFYGLVYLVPAGS